MIIGHGIDIVDVERVRRLLATNAQFSESWLTEAECLLAQGESGREEFLAGRIAAKEAVVKALGTGFVGDLSWADVEILRAPSGGPIVVLSGEAARLAQQLGVHGWSVSISHTNTIAVASAIASGAAPSPPRP